MTSERKTPWTEGPWRVEGLAIYGPGTPEGRDTCIAIVQATQNVPRDVIVKRCRLIAAAPRMADLLREICDPYFGEVWGTVTALDRWRSDARALLSRIGAAS